MPDTLAARLHRLRTVRWWLFAALAVFGVVFALWRIDVVPLWIEAGTALILAGGIIGLSRSRRNNVRDLLIGDVEDPRFGAPARSGYASMFGLLALAPWLCGFELFDRPVTATKIVVTIACALVGVAWLVGLGRHQRRNGANVLRLRPGGLQVPSALGSFHLAWEHVTEVAVDRRALRLRYPSGAPRFIAGTPLGSNVYTAIETILVDTRWLAGVIQHYVDNPDARGAIGTAAELDRLRTLEFPSTPRSAKTAL